MVPEKSLVVYKNRPALVTGGGDKITISIAGGDTLKVREKDIEPLHPGPCALQDLNVPLPEVNVREAWELLLDTSDPVPLKELAELVYGSFSPRTAWAVYELLRERLYFTGDTRSVRARDRAAVEETEKKREEKKRETEGRAAFLEKLKKPNPFQNGAALSEGDRRFLQDVEALALGKTDKSRTMKDLGKSETPQEAHRLLLAAGVWTVWENPHPSRLGLSLASARLVPENPPREDRVDLSALPAYAIDNPWSDDPDDAVSLEFSEGEKQYVLWVHVADPASSVLAGSPVDIEARGRGATLYLPEGAARMLAPEALPLFALGLTEISPALSFKIVLDGDLAITEAEIVPSLVKVTRLTYEAADTLISGGTGLDGKILAALWALAERNVERRLNTGAVVIDLPEAHIHVHWGREPGENLISVEPIKAWRSAEMVRECMILAGEAAARWALRNKLPFPFISQEAGELPDKRLPGLAGAWQLRRCMRPRSLSSRPGIHWGLGLDEYTQVTSPLRRYTDLLCHQQIRAFLRGTETLSEEEIVLRASTAEVAGGTAGRAERFSRVHWTAVYLSDKKDSAWEGMVMDRKGNRAAILVPALGIETQVNLRGEAGPNDPVKLTLSSVRIPEGEAVFSEGSVDK
jgi:exoribonuclease-2